MNISIIQIFLVVVFACFLVWDGMNLQLTVCCQKVIAGFGVGLFLGEPIVGLEIGATLELMSLGVAALGGASVPDYPLGAMMGTMVAVMAGKGAEYGLMVGLPFSLLAIQLDVMVRTGTVFFVHQAHRCANRLEMKKCYTWLWNGYTLWYLKYALPIIVLFAIGPDNMTNFMNAVPEWLINGFKVAGGMLPVVGIAILMRFMNAKNYIAYLLIGFALASFLAVPMIGIAIFGVALGIIEFKRNSEQQMHYVPVKENPDVVGGSEDEL